MIDVVLWVAPAVVSFVIVDRLLARYYTGSWTGRTSDLGGDDESIE